MKSSGGRSAIGASATATITGVCLLLSGAVMYFFARYLGELGMPEGLNEVGDALAGFASSLALIWLVGGYFLQQHELRETRREYAQIRENSEFQSRMLRRDNCVKATRLYLTSLDAALESFYIVYLGFHERFEGERAPFDKHVAVGVLIDLLESRGKDYRNKDRKAFDLLCVSLRQEVLRFAAVYSRMASYLESEADGSWVRSVLVDDSVYKDIMLRIKEAATLDEYNKKVFAG